MELIISETFAPVAKINSIRISVSSAAHLNWPLLQYDVKRPSYMES